MSVSGVKGYLLGGITGGVLAVVVEYALSVSGLWAQISLPVPDALGGGLTGGAVVAGVSWGVYKARIDEHGRQLIRMDIEKADKISLHAVTEQLHQIHEDVRFLVRERRDHG